MAAEEQALRMGILPRAHGIDIGLLAPGLDEIQNALQQRRLCRLRPFIGQQRVMEQGVILIGRKRRAEIDEVAVEVDIVLVHPPPPGKAMGVEGMDENQRCVGGQPVRQPPFQQGRLDRRAAIALDAVRAGNDAEHLLRAGGAYPGHIHRQILSARPFQGMRIGGERASRLLRRRAKAGAGGGVIRRKIIGGLFVERFCHGHEPGSPCLVIPKESFLVMAEAGRQSPP
ncbi:MAG: hypothetical protein PW790_05525 [Parvibaculaceae bacterium]|nr:hypothetical protein [Parvibaculaceae bacterium]